MTSVVSIFVGIIGAVIAIIVNEILNKFEIDDVVGAVPVHLAAGVWGTLAVGFFSDLDILGTDLTRIEQIKAQFIGVISIGFFSFVGSYVILKTLNYFYPLRVSPLQEELGLNIAEHNATSVEHDLISILDKQSQSGDLTIRGPQDPFTAGGVIGLYYNKLMSKLESSESENEKWRKPHNEKHERKPHKRGIRNRERGAEIKEEKKDISKIMKMTNLKFLITIKR